MRLPCLLHVCSDVPVLRGISRPQTVLCLGGLRISCQRASVKILVDCVNRTPEQRTFNPRVRGSSPWRRTRSDLGFNCSRSSFFTLCGAALRPAWGREMFEMPAHPAVLCLSEASFAYGHDDNRRSACARRCGSVRLAFSCLGQRRACRVRPGVRFTSEGWSSQAGAAPAVRAADLPGRMRPGTASRARASRVRRACPRGGVFAEPGAAVGGGCRARGSLL